MNAKNGDTVKIFYRGQLESGEEFDENFGREPIEFTVGDGQVIEAIDRGVVGLQPGERREVEVTPENGYGERRSDLVRTVQRSMLGDVEVAEGEAVEIQTEDGQLFLAEVKSIDNDSVTLDLNHPFAGHKLAFEIELVDVLDEAA